MGYRSDVALALTREGCQKLQSEIASARGKEVEVATKLLANPDKHLCDSDTGVELWYWATVKWYNDYPDVAFIENFITLIAADEDYRFMRIGIWTMLRKEETSLKIPSTSALCGPSDLSMNKSLIYRYRPS